INPNLNEPFISRLNNTQSKEAWEGILKEAKDFKGIIVIENIFENNPAMLKELIQTINLPNIKVNLDLGHVKLGNEPLENCIKELKEYTYYIHLHSNNGVYDQHLKPSQEEINSSYELLAKDKINPAIAL